MSKKKKRVPRYSPISKHKQKKGQLLPPLYELPIKTIDWERDLLPEHLWIDCLSKTYVQNVWQDMFERFLDALDEYSPKGKIINGFVSDFGLIPPDKREEFVNKHEKLIFEAFHQPIGRIFTLYPEAPCNWMILKRRLDIERPIDAKSELEKLSQSVIRLLPGRDLHAGHIRTIPFTRSLKHGKIYFKEGMEIADLLPKYPSECSEDEKYFVQQQVRMMMNMEFENNEFYKEKKWSKYFWKRNLELVPCIPHLVEFKKDVSLSEKDIKEIYNLVEKNSKIAIEYLNNVSMSFKYDLYDTERDEILLGLFSRLSRLYVLILSNPPLWSRDIASILLRCLAETAITFAFLLKIGSDDDFRNFKAYGEGKEKLLMLHLQDKYPEKKSLEGKNSDEIAEGMGWGFTPELIDINLSDWTKKSTRQLAIDSGLDEIYRLVYDPASSDIHGTWVSITKSNLVRCIQPLHRFHRMPQYFEPFLYVNTLKAVQDIYLKCAEIGIQFLNFPKIEPTPTDFSQFLERKKDKS